MQSLLSRDNKLVKYAIKLKSKKYRDLEKKFIAEGIRFVEEAIIEGNVEYVLYSSKLLDVNGCERILNSSVQMYEVDNAVIKELCETENPQGIASVVRKSEWNLKSLNQDFIVIADGIQDPGNLGTIIRTSDAAGAGAVYIIKGTVDVFNSKTLRSTMGSIFHVPIFFFDSFEEAIESLKSSGFNVYATSLESSEYIYNYNFKDKTAIVIGNEANGVPEEHIALSTYRVKIPMPGRAESLNAGIAAGVLIYEVIRQRLTK
jgi:TrmH family RNA methyltransferase